MPGKAHHSEKWHRCWEKVQESGKDENAAAAICTAQLGDDSYDSEATSRSAERVRELHILGAIGKVRRAMHDGREHIVVPLVALMEGVIHAINAQTPEYVPVTALRSAPQGWNGRPVMLGHPIRNGVQVSANSPEVLSAHCIGTVFESRLAGSKLLMEAWLDPLKVQKVPDALKLLQKIENGEVCEVSVGAFVLAESKAGVYNGKQYKGVWKDIIPDHLAFLPKGVGACSVAMGCGTHRAAEQFETPTLHLIDAEGIHPTNGLLDLEALRALAPMPDKAQVGDYHVVDLSGKRVSRHKTHKEARDAATKLGSDYKVEWFRAAGGPGSGNFGHGGRPGSQGGSSSGEGSSHVDEAQRSGNAQRVFGYASEAKSHVSDVKAHLKEKGFVSKGQQKSNLGGTEHVFEHSSGDRVTVSQGTTQQGVSPKSVVTVDYEKKPPSESLKRTSSRTEARDFAKEGGHVREIKGTDPRGLDTQFELVPKGHPEHPGQKILPGGQTADEFQAELEKKGNVGPKQGKDYANDLFGQVKYKSKTQVENKMRDILGMRRLGGPGSGWTREGGHVPGAQGGHGLSSEDASALREHVSTKLKEAEQQIEKAGPALTSAINQRIQSYKRTQEALDKDTQLTAHDRYKLHDELVSHGKIDLAKRVKKAGPRGIELKGMGGPGSGWTREGGHVPAAEAHKKAAEAHTIAAQAGKKWNELRGDKSSEGIFKGGHAMNAFDKASAEAHTASKEATSATKSSKSNPYASEASKAYADMAEKSKHVEEAVKFHESAASMHESASAWHKAADKVQVGGAKPSGRQVGENAWKLNSKLTQVHNPLNRGGKKIKDLGGKGSGNFGHGGRPGEKGGSGASGEGALTDQEREHLSSAFEQLTDRAMSEEPEQDARDIAASLVRLDRKIQRGHPLTDIDREEIQSAVEQHPKLFKDTGESILKKIKTLGGQMETKLLTLEEKERLVETLGLTQKGVGEMILQSLHEGDEVELRHLEENIVGTIIRELEDEEGKKYAFAIHVSTPFKDQKEEEFKTSLIDAMDAGTAVLRFDASPYDSPAQIDSEENAELVAYKTMRELCDILWDTYEPFSNLIDELIAAEESSTNSAEGEAAETELEQVQLESMRTYAMTMYSGLNAVMSLIGSCMAKNNGGSMASPLSAYAAKMEDCPTCKGSGNVDGNPCEACDGKGEIRVAAGARHSSGDREIIQHVHDNAVALGADCPTARAAEGQPTPTTELPRGSEEGETMKFTKEQKTEVIRTLVADKHSGFTAGDEKILEAASDERLEAFRVAAEARTKEVKDSKVEKQLTEEDFMRLAPESLRSLITRTQAADTSRKAELVAALKACQEEYSESELSAMSLDALERMGRLAKLEDHEPPTSFAGRPVPRTASGKEKENDVYLNPPDPYAPGLKKLREAQEAQAARREDSVN